MTRIINNLTRSAGRLLLSVALTAAVTSFVSCTKDKGAINLGDNPTTTLTVANLPGFGDANTTRANASTRAFNPNAPIGTPDVGKTTWEENDRLAITVSFYANQADQQSFGRTRAYATYKSGTWVLGDGLTTITDNKNLPLGVAGGKVVWPINAKAISVRASYSPEKAFNADGNVCLIRPEEAGKWEEWHSTSGLITTPGAPIVFEKWEASYARVRIAAVPGDVVKFTAPGFHPAGGLHNSSSGEPVGYLTGTADAKGNVYFYGGSEGGKHSVIVSLTHSALYGDTETTVFQNEINFSLTPEGKSYAINALDRSAMDDTYNWEDTYVGTIANLNPAKSKWVITDEEPSNEAYQTLKDALKKIATDSPTRRVSIELTRAKSVGENAFASCTALESITLPAATSIGNTAFTFCAALESITLPAATSIGENTFSGCKKLTTVELPAATSIGETAFYSCSALESITLPAATSIGHDAFASCTALESITLPKATSIGNNAFASCTALESITLPAAMSIGGNAFNRCKKLATVELLVATSIGGGAFFDCTALKSITLPKAMSIEVIAFYNCTALESITLPKAMSIGETAFSFCEKLATVELPAATSIGDAAFANCIALESINLPKATSIEEIAFYGCKKLATVELLVATSIGNNAFDNCTALQSINLPKATSIGKYAFQNCTTLESINLPAATSIEENTFNKCEKLATVELPVATSIGKYAFVNCTALKSITLPKATSIGEGAFALCTALESITLPKATEIGNYAFGSNTTLTTLTFGTPITKWENNVLSPSTTNSITLTLAAGQKAMAQDEVTREFTATASDFDFVNSGNIFCNCIFKEIKQAK